MDTLLSPRIMALVLAALCGVLAALLAAAFLKAIKFKGNPTIQKLIWLVAFFVAMEPMKFYLIPKLEAMGRARAQAQLQANKPFTVTAEDHRFTATFPPGLPAPVKGFQAIPSPLGPIPYTSYFSNLETSAFSLGQYQYPQALFAQKTEEDLLQGAGNGALNAMGATATESTFVKVGNHTALRLSYSGTETKDAQRLGQKFNGKILLVCARPRMFILMGMYGEDQATAHPELQAFFDSLTLKD